MQAPGLTPPAVSGAAASSCLRKRGAAGSPVLSGTAQRRPQRGRGRGGDLGAGEGCGTPGTGRQSPEGCPSPPWFDPERQAGCLLEHTLLRVGAPGCLGTAWSCPMQREDRARILPCVGLTTTPSCCLKSLTLAATALAAGAMFSCLLQPFSYAPLALLSASSSVLASRVGKDEKAARVPR